LANSYRDRINDENDCLNDLNQKEKKIILDATQEIIEWLKKNPNATEEEINEKIRELQNKTRPIIDRAEARKELQNLINNLRDRSKNEETIQKLSESDKKLIKIGLDDTENWLSKKL